MLRITLSIVLVFSLATLFNAGCDSNYSENGGDSGGGGATSQPDRTIDDIGEDNDNNNKGDTDNDSDNAGESGGEGEMKPPPQPYAGPEFRIEIQTMESEPQQYVFSYEVTVPSGGYKLSKDDAKLINGHLELYLTLQKPGPEDIVTMALVTHEGSHNTGTEKITSVDVYVKRTQRSVDNSQAEYTLAASLPG